ncbi:hypothetical protein [Vibrio phage Va2]|nr:hypothetical protein [Vibrio phage Va2]
MCSIKKLQELAAEQIVRGRVVLYPVASLKPHEHHFVERLDLVRKHVIKKGKWTKPIVVDASTGIVADGHHRRQLGIADELTYIPAVLINYQDSEDVVVYKGHGSEATDEIIDPQEIIDTVLAGELMPKKYTRHQFSFEIPDVSIDISRLK